MEIVPTALIESTIALTNPSTIGKAAATVSASVIALAEGVTLSMFSNTWKSFAILLLATSVVAGGAGVLANPKTQEPGDAQPAPTNQPTPIVSAPAGEGSKQPLAPDHVQALRERATALENRQDQLEAEIKRLTDELKGLRDKEQPTDNTQEAVGPRPTRGKKNFHGPGSKDQDPLPAAAEKEPAKPPLSAASSIPETIASPFLIAAYPPERDRFLIYIKQNSAVQPKILSPKIEGTWTTYTAPKGTKATPVLDGILIAPLLMGEKISQVTVFNAATGDWYPQEIQPPARGMISPKINGGTITYVVDNRVYAFSLRAAKWDMLELKKGERPQPVSTPWGNGYRDSSRLSLFDTHTGQWKNLDWETIEAKAKAQEKQEPLMDPWFQ